MNKLFPLALLITIFATSCSKKSETKPTPNSVTINGKSYSTVVIGNQTWTAVNYDGPGGIANSNAGENLYGKYYTFDEMQTLALPAGWRVPTRSDFENLLRSQQGIITTYTDGSMALDSLSSNHLRSNSNWSLNGDNKSGFNSEPAGIYYDSPSPSFMYLYNTALFWSTTPSNSNAGHYVTLEIDGAPIPSSIASQASVDDSGGYFRGQAMSLRFVKDN